MLQIKLPPPPRMKQRDSFVASFVRHANIVVFINGRSPVAAAASSGEFNSRQFVILTVQIIFRPWQGAPTAQQVQVPLPGLPRVLWLHFMKYTFRPRRGPTFRFRPRCFNRVYYKSLRNFPCAVA